MARVFYGLLMAAVLGTAAQAETLDFSRLAQGPLKGSLLVGAVHVTGTDTLWNRSATSFPGAGGAVCAAHGSTDNCAGVVNMAFSGRIDNLGFTVVGAQPGEVATILLYRYQFLVGKIQVTSSGHIDLTPYGMLTRIRISQDGTGNGMAYGQFSYRRLSMTYALGPGNFRFRRDND